MDMVTLSLHWKFKLIQRTPIGSLDPLSGDSVYSKVWISLHGRVGILRYPIAKIFAPPDFTLKINIIFHLYSDWS